MSYKNRLHPTVSNAEIKVFEELSKRGLTGGLFTQIPIVLRQTTPDFQWFNKKMAVYLDGDVVHRKRQEQDEEVDFLLEKRGWRVLRIPYSAPLSQGKLMQVLDQIEVFISQTG